MSVAADAGPLRRDVEVIGLVGLAHGTSHFFHLLLPPLFPWLIGEFGLSYTELGFLITVFFVVSGVGQALAGFVVDRFGARPVLLSGIATLAASGFLLAAASGYAGLMVAAAVAGLGNSIFHPADFTLLNRRVSTPRLGHAFAVHSLAGNLGWAAAPVFMAGLAALADWHVAALAAGGVGLAVWLLLFVRRDALDDRAAERSVARNASSDSPGAARFGFLRSGAVWMCFLFFFFATGALGVLQSYAPAVLGNVYGLPLALATASLTAYLLGGAGGTLVGGFIAARTESNDGVIVIALGTAALLALLLASGVAPAAGVVGLMAAMGFGVGIATPSRDLLVRKAALTQFGRSALGRVYGFVYSGLDIGLAVTPLVFGPLLDRGHFVHALIGVAVLQTAALLSAARVGRGARRLRAARGAAT
jgi:predicted MFS family arabinose efflux permease